MRYKKAVVVWSYFDIVRCIIPGKKFKFIKNTLINNCYPFWFIEKIIDKKNKLHNNINLNLTTILNNNNSTNSKYLKLTYYWDIVKPLQSILSSLNVKLIFTPSNTIRELYTKFKSKISLNNKSNIIYCIFCATCNRNYIGQTTQYTKKRIYQHPNSLKSSHESHSAFTQNLFDSSLPKRLLLKICYIDIYNNTLNEQTDDHSETIKE